MAQHFNTTYKKAYKWHKIDKREPFKPFEEHFEKFPEGHMWLAPAKNDKEAMRIYTTEQLEDIVKHMYRSRNRSTYTVSYGRKKEELEEAEDVVETKVGENELLEYGHRLFAEKTQSILKPMPTARKVYGYMRSAHFYTGMTEYQDEFGRRGYEILKKPLEINIEGEGKTDNVVTEDAARERGNKILSKACSCSKEKSRLENSPG